MTARLHGILDYVYGRERWWGFFATYYGVQSAPDEEACRRVIHEAALAVLESGTEVTSDRVHAEIVRKTKVYFEEQLQQEHNPS